MISEIESNGHGPESMCSMCNMYATYDTYDGRMRMVRCRRIPRSWGRGEGMPAATATLRGGEWRVGESGRHSAIHHGPESSRGLNLIKSNT